MRGVEYHNDLSRIRVEDLVGFFRGWPDPPAPAVHRKLLGASSHFFVAVAPGTSRVVGFVAALSDGVLSSYISHLEVLPEFRGRGIGSELVRRMLGILSDLYMVDLVCDPDVQPFYERLGLRRLSAMVRRNYDASTGRQANDPRADP